MPQFVKSFLDDSQVIGMYSTKTHEEMNSAHLNLQGGNTFQLYSDTMHLPIAR